MDAHLFRLFCEHARPFLEGALVEKIQEPQKNLLAMSIYGKGGKRQFFFHHGKQAPFCFFSSLRLPANAAPSARIMRVRKYFSQKRIAAVIPCYWRRELWLMAAGQPLKDGANPWLCLDFKSEPALYFLDHADIPEMDHARWPDAAQLENALQNWRDWPVLTPALRKTLLLLDQPERLALMNDLEEGGGEVFIYKNAGSGAAARISAWPLPKEFAEGLQESSCGEILTCLETAGRDLCLAPLFRRRDEAAVARLNGRIRQLERLLANLAADEQKLLHMATGEKTASALQSALWRLDKDSHLESLRLGDAEETIFLDKRLSILENMRHLFKSARRGKRGLKILAERRQMLEKELEELREPGDHSQDLGITKKQPGADTSATFRLAKTLPKNVSAFRSSDGFLLLRGKNSDGNAVARRMSAPHDLWAHVEKGQGAHVIIRRNYPGQEIPESTLDEAGSLAANKSWLAQSDKAAIMYAEIRYVKPIRKGAPGMAAIDKLACTRLVKVRPELEQLLLP